MVTVSPELLRSLKFLFSSASRGRNPSEVFEEVKQHGIPKSWEDEARHHAPQQYRTISKKQFMKIMELLGFDNVPLERMYEVFGKCCGWLISCPCTCVKDHCVRFFVRRR